MLTDFGIAHMAQYPDSIFETASGEKLCGFTVRWAACEILTYEYGLNKYEQQEPESESDSHHEDFKGKPTEEADIWAFGMVIYVCGYGLVHGNFAHHIPRK